MGKILKEIGPYHLRYKDIYLSELHNKYRKNKILLYIRNSYFLTIFIVAKNIWHGHPWLEIINSVILYLACLWAFIIFIIPLVIVIYMFFSENFYNIINFEINIKIYEDKITGYIINGLDEYPWEKVNYIYQTKKYIYIYVRENSAYIIPKRVFKNEIEIDDFLKIINQLLVKQKSFHELKLYKKNFWKSQN